MVLEIEKTRDELEGIFGMGFEQALILDNVIKTNNYTNLLELGFAHGVSSCYFASILKDMGGGNLTTIDIMEATNRHPNIEELLNKLNLSEYVDYYFENTSYTCLFIV